jgi:arabinogalactan endo-1,4-beta-galactosidase
LKWEESQPEWERTAGSRIRSGSLIQPRKMKKYFPILLTGVLLLACSCKKSPLASFQPPPGGGIDTAFFAKGADISWLTEMEANGYTFYDSNGIQKDCMQVLKGLGMNAVRLRAWVNPANGWCNTRDLVEKALRAKNIGFKIMIDFHYSDSWADPGKQTKPAAWSSLNFVDLQSALYNYTFHVMDTLLKNGILPEWVQIGNETNDGLLWEDGRASVNMNNFASLVNAGSQAVKAVNDSIRIIVHISNGFDNNLFRWVFDGLKTNAANWDIIGMSLYPSTGNWSAVDDQCLANMKDMVTRYGKKIMICEIGMDVNAPVECRSFITDLISKTKSLPGGAGLGVFYWEPESYNWQNYSLGAFDNTGKPTVALRGFSN